MSATDGATGFARATRRLAFGAGAATVTMSALGAASWKASDALLRPRAVPERFLRLVDVVPSPPDERLAARFGVHAAAQVRIGGSRDGIPGTWGLTWESGWGVLGDAPAALGPRDGPRPLLLLDGDLPDPDRAGHTAVLRPACWPDHPASGPVAVRPHVVEGPIGPLPCWSSDSIADTHVVLVHGRMAKKAQLWRHLAAIDPLGVSWTVASYRNDPGAPMTGMYELGSGEWADIEAVLDDAVRRGAQRVVLLGMSMGGAIVAKLLAGTTHGRRIAGVVLDAPVLDWASVLRHVTSGRRGFAVMRPLVPAVLALSAHRTNLERKALRLLVDADRLAVPVLLLHGSADRVVPVATSDALATARPDLVTYERFDAAGHVTSWNADPAPYDAALATFLRAVA